MEMDVREINGVQVAQIVSGRIATAEGGTNLVGNLYFQGINKVILDEENISPEFFDLKTGLAGEILQKFSTYRIRLAIVGDFRKYTSKSIRDFILESNARGQICFVGSEKEAIEILTGRKE
jgi:hypothetical protein